jgi:gamma-glutamyltranspeptidase/glutathione hydrolase
MLAARGAGGGRGVIDFGDFSQQSAARRVVKPGVETADGVVVAQNRVAASVGARVLARGGNAVDAAVATALAVGVVEPWMSGLGGGGGMLIRRPGAAPQVVDFTMVAPAGLDPADYPLEAGAPDDDLFGWPPVKDARNLRGATSVAVPGAIAGYGLALERFGTIAWADAMAPAIELAESGLLCDWFAILQIASAAADLARFPASVAAFLPGGQPPGHPQPPARIPRPDLAATLLALAEQGPRAFYEGPIAEGIVADVREGGGALSLEDLSGYRAVIREPLAIPFAGGTVHALPELSGGPTMARALRALDGALPDAPSAAAHVAVAEALYESFADRLARMGDEAGRRGETCTTHISVVDGEGTLVALTTTLLSGFGSRMVSPRTGVLLNNGINWFDPRPGRPNSLGAGKRPLCNYNPALIETAGGRTAALGASGGRRIIGAITQLVVDVARWGMDPETALAQPRMDVSGGPTLAYDPRFDPATVAALTAQFDAKPVPLAALPNSYACPSIVMAEGARRMGAADPIHPWAEAVAPA